MAVCPLYPFHVILLYLCLLLPALFAVIEGSDVLASSLSKWNLSFSTQKIDQLREETSDNFTITCSNCSQNALNKYKLILMNQDPYVASICTEDSVCDGVDGELELEVTDLGPEWSLSFNVSGTFLGFSALTLYVEETGPGNVSERLRDTDILPITVIRSKAKKTASKVFGYSVAVLISLAYINMGCALDLQVLKEVLRRPVGPTIGFAAQFIFMPLCSFVLGYMFPYTSPEMRLGLFVTGTSPGGGASNIWTILFGGNLDLSVSMTAVSTFSAFFMMPLWIFLLGEVIIAGTPIVVPYFKITTYAVMLLVPILIGISIRKCLPKVADFLVRLLKPLALFLIVFILVCGIWSQFFMIQLIDWKVAVVGFALPWLGFAFGCLFSKLCKRERKDIIAIAIETGIQNTGMSIFMLWFTLDHPLGDLAAVVPVAVATLTPFPLLAALAYYKLRARCCPHDTHLSSIKEEKEGGIEGLQLVRDTESTSPIIKEEKLTRLLEEDAEKAYSQDNQEKVI